MTASRFSRLLSGSSRALRALGRQPVKDRALFARAWCTVLWCKLRLRYPGLLKGDALLRDEAPAPPPAPRRRTVAAPRALEVFGRAVEAQPFDVSGQLRSLALKRYLRGQGIDSRLHLGVRRGDGSLSGHAWLERRVGAPSPEPATRR